MDHKILFNKLEYREKGFNFNYSSLLEYYSFGPLPFKLLQKYSSDLLTAILGGGTTYHFVRSLINHIILSNLIFSHSITPNV